MRVLGLIKYTEEEERTYLESFILGILGIPLGALVAIYFGLLKKNLIKDPIGWLIADAPLFATVFAFWWLTTTVFTLTLWRRKQRIHSWSKLGRIFFPTIIIPLVWVYVLLLFAFIFNPLFGFLLQYYSPYGTFWIGAGVFLPFLLLFAYMIDPDLRPHMRRNLRSVFTRSFWRRAWRNPKSGREIKILLALFVILVILHLWPMLT